MNGEYRWLETSAPKHQIRYRAYRHIPYVAHPVSKEFQSLDMLVPVEVDGKPIDARHAPIVLNITVGSYLRRPPATTWWLRTGSRDDGISPSVMVNLGPLLENHGKDVDTAFFWDGGHCADDDPQGMIDWIGRITGYSSGVGAR